MDKDELGEYVERSMSLAEESPQMDEANTKKRLVEPFVEDVLGWDGFSDVELEYSVQMGRNPKKVDYALILEDTPVVFVEAKGLDESLSEAEEKQLRSYMRQVGVDWGVLTNGERFKFLKREKGTTKPSEITFGDLRLDELTRNEDVVRTVSKGSVESGEAERIAGEIQRKKEAVSSLREKKDIIAEEVVSVVTDHVDGSVAPVAETEAKEFVDRVVEELENGEVITSEREKAKQDEDVTERASDEEGAVSGSLSRNEIDGDDDAKVAIFPTKESGIEFLRENNAWGFVRVGDEPEYVGMYVASPEQQIRFFAKVDEIIPANEANLAKPTEEYTDKAKFDPDKKVIKFKQGSLYQIENPIKYDGYTPQSLVYTSLKKFKEADSTSDLR